MFPRGWSADVSERSHGRRVESLLRRANKVLRHADPAMVDRVWGDAAAGRGSFEGSLAGLTVSKGKLEGGGVEFSSRMGSADDAVKRVEDHASAVTSALGRISEVVERLESGDGRRRSTPRAETRNFNSSSLSQELGELRMLPLNFSRMNATQLSTPEALLEVSVRVLATGTIILIITAVRTQQAARRYVICSRSLSYLIHHFFSCRHHISLL
jgi:hypothetical protein